MPSLWGDAAQKHPTIATAEASARKTLVVDGWNQRPYIDVSPVTQSLSPISSLQDVKQQPASPIGNGKNYPILNDQAEQSRLDLHHQIYLTTLDGKLLLAPIRRDIKSALDVASGTGIWGISFAQKHPDCKVFGFDLEECTRPYVPSNYIFQVHDPEAPWPFTSPFDFIHGRSLSARLNSASLMIEHAFNALAPGSFLELQDYILPMHSIDSSYVNSITAKWQGLVVQGSAKLGRDITQVKEYKKFMEERGFVDVVEVHFQWPLGPWAKSRKLKAVGALFREDLERVVEGVSMGMLGGGLGMDATKISRLVEDMKREWAEQEVHIYLPIVIVYGRKPE